MEPTLQRLDVPTCCLQLEFARFQALEDLGRGLVHGATRCSGVSILRPGSAGVAYVSASATLRQHNEPMTREHAGKARWARGKAEDLHRQARELEQDRSGDWQAMARRRLGAARLRREADRFDSMAARWGDPDLCDAA